MLRIRLLYKLTRKVFWFQSNFTPFLFCQKKRWGLQGLWGLHRPSYPQSLA